MILAHAHYRTFIKFTAYDSFQNVLVGDIFQAQAGGRAAVRHGRRDSFVHGVDRDEQSA